MTIFEGYMWLLAGIGAALGAVCRYGVGVALAKYRSFFWGTLLVNILGSFLLGMLMGYRLQEMVGSVLWVLLAEGFLGAFTTFSTFSYESFTLFKSGKHIRALIHILLNLVLGISFAYIGFKMAMVIL